MLDVTKDGSDTAMYGFQLKSQEAKEVYEKYWNAFTDTYVDNGVMKALLASNNNEVRYLGQLLFYKNQKSLSSHRFVVIKRIFGLLAGTACSLFRECCLGGASLQYMGLLSAIANLKSFNIDSVKDMLEEYEKYSEACCQLYMQTISDLEEQVGQELKAPGKVKGVLRLQFLHCFDGLVKDQQGKCIQELEIAYPEDSEIDRIYGRSSVGLSIRTKTGSTHEQVSGPIHGNKHSHKNNSKKNNKQGRRFNASSDNKGFIEKQVVNVQQNTTIIVDNSVKNTDSEKQEDSSRIVTVKEIAEHPVMEQSIVQQLTMQEIKKQSQDCLVEDRIDGVTIEDKDNRMLLKLFGSFLGQSYMETLVYRDNVIAWFRDYKKALEDQGYLDKNNKKYAPTPQAQTQAVRIHKFSPLVDEYVASLGGVYVAPSLTKSGWDTHIEIPGRVCYSNGRGGG